MEEIEPENIETNVIEGQMLDFYYEKFLNKHNRFKEYKYIKPHQLEDLYNIYYSRKYKYIDGDPTWTDILSRFDKTLFKFLTNSDPMYCEKLLPVFYKHLNEILAEIEEEKENQKREEQSSSNSDSNSKGKNSGNGGNSGNDAEDSDNEGSEEIKEAQSSLTEDQQQSIEDTISCAMSEAKKIVEKQQKEDEKKQKKTITSSGNGDGGREQADPKIVMDLLNKVDLRSSSIDKFIKQTVKGFKEHFSNISKIEIEPLLDAEEITEIDGIELITMVNKFPFLWDEISNVTKQYSCVVDAYIDNSGSMQSNVNINSKFNSFTGKGGTANYVRMIDLAKVLAYKLYSDKYIADIYKFEHNCVKIDINRALTLPGSGGTNIDGVIATVRQTNRPSLVITDGCDSINDYSDLIYIINVSPGEFEWQISYKSGSVKKMIEKNQILAFVDNRFLTPAQYKIYAGKK